MANTQAPEVSILKKVKNSFFSYQQDYSIPIQSAPFKSITLYLNNEMMVQNVENNCSQKKKTKALEKEVLRSFRFLKREHHA